MQKFARIIRTLVGSAGFFYVVLALFAIGSAWIALSATYPQAFDEQFHFGLIRLHAEHWLPYFTSQPANAGQYGAAVRDPSYLYHYLLSLPYRLIAHFTSDQMVQIVSLRFINIGFAVAGLAVYARLLRRLGASRMLTNVVMLFVTLIPVVPLLAAHINYDNLFFLLSGFAMLWAVEYLHILRTERRIDLNIFCKLVVIGLLASLVKYAYLPMLLVLGVAVIWPSVQLVMKQTDKARAFVPLSRLRMVVYALLVLLSAGLFFERYGINMIKYHTPIPECDQVLSVQQCQPYLPWVRNYQLKTNRVHVSTLQYVTYPGVWVHRQVSELMFTIASNFNPDGTVQYYPAPPMPVANITAWAVLVGGVVCVAAYGSRLWAKPDYRFLLILSLVYSSVLLFQNFNDYIQVGEAVGVHGRYLLPIIPVLLLCIAESYAWVLRGYGKQRLGLVALPVIVLLFLDGGGITNWVMRSDNLWYWPGAPRAAELNTSAKRALSHIEVL